MNIDTNKIQATLEAKKKRLELELADIGERDTEEDDEPSDRLETAETLTEFDSDAVVTSALETELQNINEALDRIKSHTYGTCEICNNPIEDDRLEAEPAARTCKLHLNS